MTSDRLADSLELASFRFRPPVAVPVGMNEANSVVLCLRAKQQDISAARIYCGASSWFFVYYGFVVLLLANHTRVPKCSVMIVEVPLQ